MEKYIFSAVKLFNKNKSWSKECVLNIPLSVASSRVERLLKHRYEKTENGFKIMFTPSFFDPFDPFAPRGIVNISFVSNDNDPTTRLHFDIKAVSYIGNVALLLFLLVWGVLVLLFSFSWNRVLTVLFGWLMFSLLMIGVNKLNKGKLDNYVDYFMDEINE